MTFWLRTLTIGLAVYALVSLAAAVAVAALARRHATWPPVLRARRLAALRLAPASLAAAAGFAATIAFLVFEPRRTSEDLGLTLQAAALLALAMLAAAVWRWLRLARATNRLTRAWLEKAEPIALPGISARAMAVAWPFPLVAVVGVRKPMLIIARSVLDACTREELAAILAHEQAHIDRRDNLRRLLFALAPDPLAWLPVSARFLADWSRAAEQAADDHADVTGDRGRWHLASALVKVARIAAGGGAPSALVPASALYCGRDLDARVRRLLDPQPPSRHEPAARPRAGARALITAAASTASLLALPGLHALIELAVRVLP
jgi:Zn-dependent protease with chaperone function